MSETISKANYKTVFSSYGIPFSEEENGVVVTGKSGKTVTFTWTKTDRIPPKSKAWNVLRSYEKFAADYPKTTTLKPDVRPKPETDPTKANYWTSSEHDAATLEAIGAAIAEAIKTRKVEERQADLAAAKALLEKHGLSLPENLDQSEKL